MLNPQTLNVGGDEHTAKAVAELVANGGRVVTQYGPEWMAHALAGGEVRYGNVLIGEVQDA